VQEGVGGTNTRKELSVHAFLHAFASSHRCRQS